VSKEYITVQLGLTLDKQGQEALDTIEEYWKASEIDGTQPFKNWTRQQALTAALELGITNDITAKAKFYKSLMKERVKD
jgi:hypothetical protein